MGRVVVVEVIAMNEVGCGAVGEGATEDVEFVAEDDGAG